MGGLADNGSQSPDHFVVPVKLALSEIHLVVELQINWNAVSVESKAGHASSGSLGADEFRLATHWIGDGPNGCSVE